MSHDALPRADYMKLSPQLFKKYLDFSLAIELDATLAHLIDIRASQLNGCAFCLDMHVKQAHMHGERALRLHHIAIWRESPLFTPRERAVLAWTEALTRLGEGGVPDALYAEVREQFSEKELCELTFRVVAINGWNRANVALRTVPGSKDQAFGLSQSGLS